MKKTILVVLVLAAAAYAQQQNFPGNGSGGGGSGTVSPNTGAAGQLAVYSGGAGGTTVGPDALAVDNGTQLSYTGTGGEVSTSQATNGTGAGLTYHTQGTDNSSTCPANSKCSEAPAAITTSWTEIEEGAGPGFAGMVEMYGALSGTTSTKSYQQLNGAPFYAIDGGAANAYAITSVPGLPCTLVAGVAVSFKAANASTAASTLNVTPLNCAAYGATSLQKRAIAGVNTLGTGDITAGGIYSARYDGTEWVLENSSQQTALKATSQRTESGADATLLSVTPPAAVGTYRIHFVFSISAATAATIGWTVTYTDSNGNAQTPTNMPLFQTGVAAPALTFTTSAAGNYYGDAIVDVNNAGTAIVVKTTFSGTSMTAKASATIERLQ